MLYERLPEKARFLDWNGQRVCVLQKEYPTADCLGKPRRQHWDIAVLSTPPKAKRKNQGYDYLQLLAAIEFGMNASKVHLMDDIKRLCHKEANVKHRFVVHLYRISKAGDRFSGRDQSTNSPQALTAADIGKLLKETAVEVYYALTDKTDSNRSVVSKITGEKVECIKP